MLGVRRRSGRLPTALRGASLDVTAGELPPLRCDLLMVALTPDAPDAAGYRRTYLEGTARVLRAVERSGHRPRRAVLVSSSSVFGDVTGEVDETTAPRPDRSQARILLETEQVFRTALPHGTVARLSGIYGPGRTRLIESVRAGTVTDAGRWTNRIHRDDAAAAIAGLLTTTPEAESVVIVTDDEPAPLGEVAAWLADRMGVPSPPGLDGPSAPHGKRLRNTRLRAAGLAPSYPSYREGYTAVLAAEGPDRRPPADRPHQRARSARPE